MDGDTILRPVGEVATEPLADFSPEGTARDDDGLAGEAASEHGGM